MWLSRILTACISSQGYHSVYLLITDLQLHFVRRSQSQVHQLQLTSPSTTLISHKTCRTLYESEYKTNAKRLQIQLHTGHFIHSPLDLSMKQIRLLRLSDAGYPTAGPISFQLEHFDVGSSSCPEYRALSYTWGSPEHTDDISINQCRFTVRRNLFEFLCAIRDKYHDHASHWFWIDAVCIEQNNTLEKNHQSAQNERYLPKCQQTIIWLGLATPESVLFFKNIAFDTQET
jgi:hypothetical protein